MDEIIIRPATESEKEWSARQMSITDPWITLGISYEACLKTCTDPEYSIYVARSGNKPCGMILLDPRGVAGSPYIKSIVVSKDFRSKGIGAKMITFAENLFRKESKHLFLCVSSFNHRAYALYENLGFKKVGEFNDYIVEGESEIIMHKRLR